MKKLNSFLDNLVSAVGIIGAILIIATVGKNTVFGVISAIVVLVVSLSLATALAKIEDLENHAAKTDAEIENLKSLLKKDDEE
jgi:cell division protein FtsB